MGDTMRSLFGGLDTKEEKRFQREEMARERAFLSVHKPLLHSFRKQFPSIVWVLKGETKSLRGSLVGGQEGRQWTCTIYVKPSEKQVDLVSKHTLTDGVESELCSSRFVYRDDPVLALKNFFLFQQELTRPFVSSP